MKVQGYERSVLWRALLCESSLLLGAGKDGILYVFDREHLGKKVGDPASLKQPQSQPRSSERRAVSEACAPRPH